MLEGCSCENNSIAVDAFGRNRLEIFRKKKIFKGKKCQEKPTGNYKLGC